MWEVVLYLKGKEIVLVCFLHMTHRYVVLKVERKVQPYMGYR